MSSPSCWPFSRSPNFKPGAREPLVAGRRSSFCSFGNSALRASLDPLLSHLLSDTRKLVRCGIVLVTLLGSWILLQFGIS